jgi:4a-hydroxytetrahydrobiopterin dehydratase
MAPNAIPRSELAAVDGLDDWRVVLRQLHAEFRADSFSGAGELLARIATEADERDHHPDLALRYPGIVRIVLTTHSAGGITELDVDLARAISAMATEAGATAQPTMAEAVEIGLDTMDADRIRPFWAAILDYKVDADGALSDPRGSGATLWFQQMDVPRTERNRFHLDIIVPHDVAEERIAAAVAAGGTVLNDTHARAFWVLADAEGNEACICTWQDRD